MGQSGGFTGAGSAPTVSSASNISQGIKVSVVFSEPMTNNAQLVDKTNYVITAIPGFTAQEVISVVVLSTTIVDLNLAGPLSLGTENYTVTVATTVTDLAGNTLDPANNNALFDGIGPPVIKPGLTALETHIGGVWSEDSILSDLTFMRQLLLSVASSQISGSPEKVIISYALSTSLRSVITDGHPDLINVDYSGLSFRKDPLALRVETGPHDARTLTAADQLLAIDVSLPYVNMFKHQLQSDEVITKLSALCTMVVLAAIITI